jgi:thiamine biosynthesis lipoprotein
MGLTSSQPTAADNDAQAFALAEHAFRAMNTDIRIFTRGNGTARAHVAAADDAIHAFEARFSRFLPESELSALNGAAGAPVRVSAAMFALLERCRSMHARTGGVFNPAVLPALAAAGYDRSFERVDPIGAAPATPSTPAPPFDRIALDVATREVRIPAGMRIDLGGIGKGYAVEQTIALLAPAHDALIDAGGDIAARGNGPDGDGWIVAIADPWDPASDIAAVRLHDEAIATSTTIRRRWLRDRDVHHHIIDPCTGASAQSGIAQVSVIAPSAVDADVFAKCALILGETDGARLIDANACAALLVRDDGSCIATSRWPSDDERAGSTGLQPAANTHHALTPRSAGFQPATNTAPNRRTPS